MKSASVTVDGNLISTIGKGLLIFAAIGKDDTTKEVESMASKVLKVKLWDGEDGKKWKCNVSDIEGEILCGAFLLFFLASSHVMPTIMVPAIDGKRFFLSSPYFPILT